MSIILKKAPKTQGYYSIPDLPEFRVRCTLPMTAEVFYKQKNSLMKLFTGSYVPGVNFEVTINFKDILMPLLNSKEPLFHLGNFIQNDFFKEIHVKLKDAETNLERVFFITNVNAKLQDEISIVLSKRFLTLQPDVKETTVDSPEFLSYFYIGNSTKKMVAKFYLNNGLTELVTLYSWNGVDVKAVTHNVSYRQVMKLSNTSSSAKKPFYDIYVLDENNHRISIIQRYVFKESTGRENYYLFYNSLGGLDTLITTGDTLQKPEVSFDIAKISSGLVELDNSDDHIILEQKSGYFSIDNIPYVTDFIMSKKDKYIFNPDENLISQIVITGNDTSFNSKESFTSFSFSYRKMNDIPIIYDTIIDTQMLVVESIQSRLMPLEMPKRGVIVHNNDISCTSDPIECTMNSILMYIETSGFLSVYSSIDAETWTEIDRAYVHGNTIRSYEDLTIGSWMRIESENPIRYIDTLFTNSNDNY